MRWLWRIVKWLGIGLVVLVLGAFLFALVRLGAEPLTLAWAKDEPSGPEASPAIALPFDREAALEALQREVFGTFPDADAVEVLEASRFEHLGGTLTNLSLRAEGPEAWTRPFGISLVTRDPDAPLIVWSSFSPRGAAIEHPSVPGRAMDGMGASLVEGVFGRYIQSPPVEAILDAGYGFAVMYPSEMVPDQAGAGEAELRRVFGGEPRTGAIAAWAFAVVWALDALEAEGLLPDDVIAAGHSRYGKSALLAGALDPRVSGVISHQSGTGGASLSRGKRGETVEQITESYPHWFAPGYSEEGLSIDQHHLLAAIAPKPVLLGGARRDVWSDPNGALRAAMGAAPVYADLTGREPLAARRLDVWNPEADIAVWTRPGTHGVVEEDWPAFLSWVQAQFPRQAERSPPAFAVPGG